MPMLVIEAGKPEGERKSPRPFKGVGGKYDDESEEMDSKPSDTGKSAAVRRLKHGLKADNDRLIEEALTSFVEACNDEGME